MGKNKTNNRMKSFTTATTIATFTAMQVKAVNI